MLESGAVELAEGVGVRLLPEGACSRWRWLSRSNCTSSALRFSVLSRLLLLAAVLELFKRVAFTPAAASAAIRSSSAISLRSCSTVSPLAGSGLPLFSKGCGLLASFIFPVPAALLPDVGAYLSRIYCADLRITLCGNCKENRAGSREPPVSVEYAHTKSSERTTGIQPN